MTLSKKIDLRAIVILILGAASLSTASCGDGSDPVGLRIDTIFVTDSSAYGLVSGRIQMYKDCETQTSAAGIRIEIPELRLTLKTDDSGYYSFRTSNIQRYYDMRLSRDGAYPLVPQNSYVRYTADSGHYIVETFKMYEHFNYAGEVDSLVYNRYFYPVVRDSTFIDQNGQTKTVTLVDSVNYSTYQFRVAGLDESNKHSSKVLGVLLFSKTPDIDPLDPTTYIGITYNDSEPGEYSHLVLNHVNLAYAGLKSGDRFYVAATGTSRCLPNAIGKRISAVQELIVR